MSSSLRIHYNDARSAGEHVDRSDDRHMYYESPLVVSFDALQKLVKHAQKLKDTIQTLQQPRLSLPLDSEPMQSKLSHAEESVEELCDFLDACAETIPIALRPSVQSAVVAQKVFNTPELLETILVYLNTHDVLVAQQVGRVWRDGVNGSVRIQRAMGLRLDTDANFFIPIGSGGLDSTFPGLKAYPSYRDFNPSDALRKNQLPQTQHVSFTVDISQPLAVGTRCRAISLCQPPLEYVTVDVVRHCYRTSEDPTTVWSILQRDCGLRVGDVLDLVQSILEDDPPCFWHDGRGFDDDSDSHLEQSKDGDIELIQDGDAGTTQDGTSGILPNGDSGTVEGYKSDHRSDRDSEFDARNDFSNSVDAYADVSSHAHCYFAVSLRGSVGLNDDDPIMVFRRNCLADEKEYRERRRKKRMERSSVASSDHSW